MTLWMRSSLKVLLVLAIGVPVTGVWAQAQELKLGMAAVPVADRSRDARAEALSQGLDQVLVKLTGTRHLDAVSGLAAVRRQPSRWAQQYSYGQDELGDATLSARFDVNGLLSGLQAAGVPVWGQTRPNVLVWMVIQRPGSGQMVAREMVDPAALALQQGAAERGVPLLLPLMDDEDRRAVTVADIRGHFDNVVRAASDRYQAPLRLTAVLYTGNQPTIRWRLFRATELLDSGELTATDEKEAVITMVDRVADRMAAAYVISAGSGEALMLNVSGVNTLAQWSTLQGFVGKLTGVDDVRLIQLNGTSARFSVTFSGTVDQLKRLLALQPDLSPCAAGGAALARVSPLVVDDVSVDGASVEAGPVAARPSLPSYCWQGG